MNTIKYTLLISCTAFTLAAESNIETQSLTEPVIHKSLAPAVEDYLVEAASMEAVDLTRKVEQEKTRRAAALQARAERVRREDADTAILKQYQIALNAATTDAEREKLEVEFAVLARAFAAQAALDAKAQAKLGKEAQK